MMVASGGRRDLAHRDTAELDEIPVLRSRPCRRPTTTRRVAVEPRGATMSSAEPFLPLNRSAAAARVTRSPVGSIALARSGAEFEALLAEQDENALGGRRQAGQIRA